LVAQRLAAVRFSLVSQQFELPFGNGRCNTSPAAASLNENGRYLKLLERTRGQGESVMQLDRKGQHAWIADANVFATRKPGRNPAEWATSVRFPAAGSGSLRRSEYHVIAYWSDVETMIQKFSDMGHPKATRFYKALMLANAVEKFMNPKPANTSKS
jgi:hypothetical protein